MNLCKNTPTIVYLFLSLVFVGPGYLYAEEDYVIDLGSQYDPDEAYALTGDESVYEDYRGGGYDSPGGDNLLEDSVTNLDSADSEETFWDEGNDWVDYDLPSEERGHFPAQQINLGWDPAPYGIAWRESVPYLDDGGESGDLDASEQLSLGNKQERNTISRKV